MKKRKIIKNCICEHCERKIGLSANSDFVYSIASYDEKTDPGKFVFVKSKRFSFRDDENNDKITDADMLVCSLDCGKRVCPPGSFILQVDLGDLDSLVGCWDSDGNRQARFW